MKESRFIDGDGLKNLRGRVEAKVVEIPGGEFELHWTCPFCHDHLYIGAVEYMTNHTIEDGRTGFAHCNGADYAIIMPKLLPVGFWEKAPPKLRPS